MNIVDPILFQCRRQPPQAAICVPAPGIGLVSYRRLETFIHNISRRLHAFGIRPRSVVAIGVDDVIFHIAIALALTRLGAATLSLRESALSIPIEVDALVTTNPQPPQTPGRAILADLSWLEGDGVPLEPHLLPQVREDDLCRIILTSGTTSESKAVALSHKILAARVNRHLTVFGSRLGNFSRTFCDIPLSSSLGFQFVIYSLWRGGTVFFGGDDFPSALRVFEDQKVQCVVGSPGGFETLLRCFESIPNYQSGFETLLCAGDVLSRSLSNRLRARLCSKLVSVYGSTEASMTATAHAHEIADLPRAVGFVNPGIDLQIVDDADTVLPLGQEGHVRIRSEYAADGYFRNPDASAKVFRNGWFYPGDIGVLDPEGMLTIAGREQSILNLGGDKINPEFIEIALTQLGGVIEAGAFSAPNELGNHELHAAVVCRTGLDEQALRSHCEAVLPTAAVPVKYHVVEGLPRNEMGKLDRRRLQNQFG